MLIREGRILSGSMVIRKIISMLYYFFFIVIYKLICDVFKFFYNLKWFFSDML